MLQPVSSASVAYSSWVSPDSESRYQLEIAVHQIRTRSECLIVFDNVEHVLAELMLVDARTDLELWHIQGSLLANVDRLLREIDLERGPDARRVRRR